jgi:thiol:disulfide interchange protein
MESYVKILNAVKYVGGTVLLLGVAIFLYGFFISDYKALTGIGIGTVMGAVFIFLMGVFLVASEDMVSKINNGKSMLP